MDASATLPPHLDEIVARALREDLGDSGDITSQAVIPADRRGTARLVARQRMVVAGLPVARAVFLAMDPRAEFEPHVRDGERVVAGHPLATVRGAAGALLAAERTALNFVQHLSGIATAARDAVDEVSGTGAVILDTRKTVPGLRSLDKYAVAVGGGTNHRMGLHDAVLIKDTHLAVARSVSEAVARARAAGHPRERITVEVSTLAMLREAIDAGAGRALLDNMSLEEIRECVALAHGRVVLEASGGLRPGGLREVARTGVDCLSVGWLTHSAPAADVAMDMEASP